MPKCSGRKSWGGANGLIAAPRKSCGGVVSLRPERNFPLARMVWTVTMKLRPVMIDEKPRMNTPSATGATAVGEDCELYGT